MLPGVFVMCLCPTRCFLLVFTLVFGVCTKLSVWYPGSVISWLKPAIPMNACSQLWFLQGRDGRRAFKTFLRMCLIKTTLGIICSWKCSSSKGWPVDVGGLCAESVPVLSTMVVGGEGCRRSRPGSALRGSQCRDREDEGCQSASEQRWGNKCCPSLLCRVSDGPKGHVCLLGHVSTLWALNGHFQGCSCKARTGGNWQGHLLRLCAQLPVLVVLVSPPPYILCLGVSFPPLCCLFCFLLSPWRTLSLLSRPRFLKEHSHQPL